MTIGKTSLLAGALFCLFVGMAAPINGPANASTYDLRLYNIDDVLSAYVTNAAHVHDLVLSAPYAQDTGFVDISDFVASGLNTLRIELQNFFVGSGYTYGWEFQNQR